MKPSKIITAVVLFCIVTFGLLEGIPFLLQSQPSLATLWSEVVTPTHCYMMGGIVFVVYLILAVRTKGANSVEMKELRNGYLYHRLDEQQKQIVYEMSEEDKSRFFAEYAQNLKGQDAIDLYNQEVRWKDGKIPDGMKPVRLLAKGVLLCAVGFFCFHTYQGVKTDFQRMMQVVPDQSLYVEGVGNINIQTGDKMTEGKLEDIISLLKETQPQFLLENCNIIRIMNQEQFDSNIDNASAFAHPDDNSINMNFKSAQDKKTITHELCHVFDFVHNIQYDATINDLYSKYASKVSDYATTNVLEFFAEAGAQYFHCPEQLKQTAPEVYDYIDQLFKPYMA